jgi:hypothetical protein
MKLSKKERMAKNAALKAWRKKNPAKVKIHNDNYKRKNPKKVYDIKLKWAKENPEKIKISSRKSYKRKVKDTENSVESSIRQMLPVIKSRAKRRKRGFSIDVDYILNLWNKQKGRCKLSGLPMTTGIGSLGSKLSIDRIDSKKGYVKGNCQLVLTAVNISKNDLTQTEFIKLCKAVAKNN